MKVRLDGGQCVAPIYDKVPKTWVYVMTEDGGLGKVSYDEPRVHVPLHSAEKVSMLNFARIVASEMDKEGEMVIFVRTPDPEGVLTKVGEFKFGLLVYPGP